MVLFRVLGPLVVDEDPTRTPTSRVRRRLLSLLLLAGGELVSRDALIADLWQGDPPRTAANTLQVHVSALRRILGADALLREADGYRLPVRAGELDATLLDTSVAAAQAARSRGAVHALLEHAEAAVGLLRGAPYVELADDPVAASEIARLEARAALAEELHVEALLALERTDDAIPHLERLVVEHPVRERLWEMLADARHAAGRTAEALVTLRQAQEQLRGQGLQPGRRLTALQHRLLSGEQGVQPVTVAGGPEPVPTAFRRPRVAAHPWDLVGRTDLLTRLHRELDRGVPGLVLSGQAGVGKSRLLHELDRTCLGPCTTLWANESLSRIPLGVFGPMVPVEPAPLDVQSRRILQGLLAMGGSTTPTILVDDANHLDPASIALMTQVLTTRAARLVLTLRTGDPVPADVTRWWSSGGLVRIEVPPLAEEDLAALVTKALGPTSGQVGESLSATAAGNPLHLRELVRAAQDVGALQLVGGRWRLHGRVAGAERVSELVDANVGSLDNASVDGLAALALARPAVAQVVEKLAGPAVVPELEGRGLVHVTSRDGHDVVDVVHPLYAENLAARLTTARRRELGHRIGHALEVEGFPLVGDRLRAARLLLDADAISPELARDATRDALARLDAGLALELARVAAIGSQRADDLLALGRAASYSGLAEEAEEALAKAAELASSPSELATIASERAFNIGFGMRDPGRGIEVLDPVIESLTEDGPRARLRVERTLLLAMTGAVRAVVEEAANLQDLDLTPQAQLSIGVCSTLAKAMLARLPGLVDEIDRLLPMATEHREELPLARDQLLSNRTSALIALGRVDDALAGAREAHREAERDGGVVTLWQTLLLFALETAGHVGEAHRFHTAAGPRLTGADPFGMDQMWPSWGAIVAAQAGDLPAARRALDTGEPTVADAQERDAVWWGRAEGWVALPDREASASAFRRAGRRALDADHLLWGAVTLHDAVRVGHADLVLDDLAEAAGRADGARLLDALVDNADAHVRGDRAALESAAKALEACGARLLAAEAWAESARVAGASGEALRATAQAQRLAEGLGARTPALVDRER